MVTWQSAQFVFCLSITEVRIFVCVPPRRFHCTNLPCSDSFLSKTPSVVIVIYEFNKTLCVFLCVWGGGSGPYCPLQSLHKLSFSQPLPPSVADNSCGYGCECFRSVLVRLVSLRRGHGSYCQFVNLKLPLMFP